MCVLPQAGRLANGPGYLDVSVSTRLDELKQRAAGQVSGAEDMARATLHARIYSELKSLVEGHAALGWQYVDQVCGGYHSLAESLSPTNQSTFVHRLSLYSQGACLLSSRLLAAGRFL